MFIYTESYTESHRNTQNINICNKTHRKHQITFRNSHSSQTSIFLKIRHQNNSEFYEYLYDTINILYLFTAFYTFLYVEGHAA